MISRSFLSRAVATAAAAGTILALSATVGSAAHAAPAGQLLSSTTTHLAATSPAAGKASFVATVTSDAGVPTGTFHFVDFYPAVDQEIVLGDVPADNGRATLTVTNQTPGPHYYYVTFFPTPSSGYDQSSDDNQLVVKTTAKITENFPARTAPGKKADGDVTIDLRGIAAAPTGKVLIKNGSQTLDTDTLNDAGKASFRLPILKDGSHELKIVWVGDHNGERTTKLFTFIQR
ncbi:Ig-like domain repeat protein [Nocardioides sp.]|uniref:Ig-like domain repeat protein n=1 Tax=Nocardioides sp. TaxID=35761 RepID=UPI0031FEE1A8|nr:phosphate transporter substrate-binding protein PhoT family [Nocardioides sp.]